MADAKQNAWGGLKKKAVRKQYYLTFREIRRSELHKLCVPQPRLRGDPLTPSVFHGLKRTLIHLSEHRDRVNILIVPVTVNNT